MDVIDLSVTRGIKKPQHHSSLPPNRVRALLIGLSNSGKTQMLLKLMTRWMKLDRLYVVASKADDHACYDVLQQISDATVREKIALLGAAISRQPIKDDEIDAVEHR